MCIFLKKFSPNLWFAFFIFLIVSFAKHRFLTLMMIDLSIFSFPHCAFAVSLKIPVHIRIQNFCPALFQKFLILDFTFLFVILFQLIFVLCVRYESRFFFFFLLMDIQLFQHHLLKRLTLCPLNFRCTFVENQFFICV